MLQTQINTTILQTKELGERQTDRQTEKQTQRVIFNQIAALKMKSSLFFMSVNVVFILDAFSWWEGRGGGERS